VPEGFVSALAAALEGPLAPTLRDDIDDDERFMALAIDEAERGLGRTYPNPPVGAVVVKDGRVIATGYHAQAGLPHAEAAALDEAGAAAQGATLYVTLEPCTHFGRTPPCADRALTAKLARVVVGVTDPNPAVRGGGLEKLRAGGVLVRLLDQGPVAARARALIAPFASSMERARPYVVAKVASSLDGRVATRTGQARWITGPESRRLVHALRDRVDAVLVGSGTVLGDDPALTVREVPGRNPCRVVVDGRLQTAPSAQVYQRHEGDMAAALVLHAAAAAARVAAFDGAGVLRLPCGGGERVDLALALRALGARGLTSVLVEPGPGLLGALLAGGLVDELWWFTAPVLIGADGRPALPARGVQHMEQALRLSAGLRARAVGADALFVGPVASSDP
jgi:diaminohydroxyphosphoribosylaminopyrimidine deaminase / 5-amino-6-(5-phosphoribosylamino)uracil reductase